jgi:hypothetical protein
MYWIRSGLAIGKDSLLGMNGIGLVLVSMGMRSRPVPPPPPTHHPATHSPDVDTRHQQRAYPSDLG